MRKSVQRLFSTALVLLAACGGSGGTSAPDGGGEPSGPASEGQVTPEWSKYCVATFSADYVVLDVFGDPDLSIEKGARYLLTDSFDDSARILYLTEGSPIDFEIKDNDAFKSSCEGDVEERQLAFTDLTVFEDEALTKQACTVKQGAVVGSIGFALVTADVYEVTFDDEFCEGIGTGYIQIDPVVIGETTYGSPPIATVLVPVK